MLPKASRAAPFWHRFDVRRIEDLGNLALGADLEPLQMSSPPVRGSLAFAAHDGVLLSSGFIKSKVMVRGALSPDALTLFIGLSFGRGSRLWLDATNEGDVGVILPGDELDGLYTSGSLCIAATLSAERLAEEALCEGIALDPRLTRETGLHERPLASRSLLPLKADVVAIHVRGSVDGCRHSQVGRRMLRAALDHYSRFPRREARQTQLIGGARVVRHARDFIRENLTFPILLDDIARAAQTSRRTLFRAFRDVLEDTPGNYVQRLRLHRIRRRLASEGEAGSTIAAISARCGIREAARMSGWYRELFGETPSETRAKHPAHLRQSCWF